MGNFSNPTPSPKYYIAGQYYLTTSCRVSASNTTSSSGVIRWVPFFVSQPITLESLGAIIGTADNGGNIEVALYAGSPTTGLPTGAPLASTSGISTTNTGAVAGAITTPVAGVYSIVTPGWYWLGINADNSTVRVTSVATDSTEPGATFGAATLSHFTNSSATQFNGPFWTTTETYGTWPTNPTVTENAQGAVANTPVGIFQVTSVP